MRKTTSPRRLIGRLNGNTGDYWKGCAAHELGLARYGRARDALIAALGQSSPWVRGWAAFALGRIEDVVAVPHLCSALGDPDHWVRERVAEALRRFDADLVTAFLQKTLKSGGGIARAWAIHVMADVGGADVAFDILPTLEDENRPVRLSAIRALCRLRCSAALPSLRFFLRDHDPHLRGAAAYALGHLGDQESVSGLCGTLRDTHPWVRRNAAWSLLNLGQALDKVASLRRDEDEGVRLMASHARRRMLSDDGHQSSQSWEARPHPSPR